MSSKAKLQSQDSFEAGVVEHMAKAKSLADQIFGAQANRYAVEEIADYLEATDDEEDFLADLQRIVEHTKIIYATTAPTPEQTFGVFERIFAEEE